MKKKNKKIESQTVVRAMLAVEITALKARLNFGKLPQGDMDELSRMIDLRKKAIHKI